MSAIEKKHADQERASSRRRQVLDAAEACFGRSGFHGASMAEISKTAGMSIGHIYNYFDGKDAIIAAFVQQNLDRVSALMENLAKRDDPLKALLDDVENSVIDNLQPGIWKLQLEIFAEASRNPAVAEVVRQADEVARGQLRTVLRRGREMRGFPDDEVMISGRIETIISMFQGLRIRILHNPGLDVHALVAGFRLALTPLLLSA